MNTISLKRIKLLLLADWYELKEYVLWGFVSITGILLAFLFYSDFQSKEGSLFMLFSFMLMITFFSGMNYVHFRSNSAKGLGFLTPAHPLEKFISQILVLLLFLISCCLVYTFSTGIYLYIKAGSFDTVSVHVFQLLFDPSLSVLWIPLFFLMSVYWLSMLSFKKKAALKSLLIVAGIILLLVQTNSDFLGYFFEQYGINSQDNVATYSLENIYPGILSIVPYHLYLLVAAIFVILYVGYLKLKEKEQR